MDLKKGFCFKFLEAIGQITSFTFSIEFPIFLFYGLPKETVSAVIVLYKVPK